MLENEVNKEYKEIQNILYKLIPEKWDSLYLYASIGNKNEMYFYYFPKKTLFKPKPINCYEIATKFGINENQYNIVLNELYCKIKKLHNLAIRKWTNITISIVNCLFTIEYNYMNLQNSYYTEEQRRVFWEYKYLHTPIERMSKDNRQILEKFFQEYKKTTSVYTEGIYIKSKKQEPAENKGIQEETNVIRNQILKC